MCIRDRIYTYNGMLYVHTQTKNSSNVPFDTDFIRFKITDKKVPKRPAIQETVLDAVRSYNEGRESAGKSTCLLYTSGIKIQFAMKKKIFLSAAILAAAVSAYAQGNGQAGITETTNLITGYFDPGTKLVYAIGAVCGLIGGVKAVCLLYTSILPKN